MLDLPKQRLIRRVVRTFLDDVSKFKQLKFKFMLSSPNRSICFYIDFILNCKIYDDDFYDYFVYFSFNRQHSESIFWPESIKLLGIYSANGKVHICCSCAIIIKKKILFISRRKERKKPLKWKLTHFFFLKFSFQNRFFNIFSIVLNQFNKLFAMNVQDLIIL